ncbi:MAG TPA: LapA family protein [Verrucomicrobiae bacterium]|nr:LapA family protein [Verrucomicrobiae bacterium]
MKPHRGVLILVLGILSFVLCGIFTAIPAWVMGSADLKEMDAGTMDPAGRGMTGAGRILGIIICIFFAVGVVLAVLFGLLGFFHLRHR